METTAGRGNVHYAWLVLAVGTLVVFGSLGLGRFAFTPILPDMQDGLGLSTDQAGALATGNNIGYLLLAVVGGVLAARFGPRVVISLSMLLVGVTMLLTGVAQSFWPAFLWRFMSGLGSGGSNVPVMALMAAWFASRRRGLAMGVAVAGSSMGLIVTGYVVPPLLTSSADGWRTAWLVLGGIVLLMALLSWVVLRDRPKERGLEPLGGTETPPSEQRASALDWRAVYRLRVVWHLAAVYIAFGFSYAIYTTFFSSYLVNEAQLSDHTAGQLWSMVGFLSLLCGVIWGAVSDRWGRNVGLTGVFLGHASSYALFAVVDGIPGYVISGILFGLTAWSVPAIVSAALGDQLGSRLAPAALGFVTLFFGIGQAAGPYIAGVFAESLESFAPTFLLASGVALLGALASALLRTGPKGASSTS
jgi:sugar phosphate permease